MAYKYLKGLNTLRFFAATLVLIDHARHHLNEINIPFGASVPMLHKGSTAVSFFFTLSGFLISYLAFNEINENKKINYKFFYIRRALRIMPLYYLVLILSIVLIGFIGPMFLNENKLGFPLLEGGALFFFMIPNLATFIWPDTVGGINILWSIGVEEQFYLLFPLIIFFLGKTTQKIRMTILFFTLYFTFYWLVQFDCFGFNKILTSFMGTLKFHYMLIGILFSLICQNYYRHRLFIRIMNSKIIQAIVFVSSILVVFTFIDINRVIYDLFLSIVFASLIVVVTHKNPVSLFNIKIKAFNYFGVISYGIYLLHPLVSYFVRFLIIKVSFINDLVISFPIVYIVFLLILTLIVAHLSFKYFESRFLNLKKKFITY